MKPDDVMELLREAHREPIPEAHFAAVRARVLAEIEAGHRQRDWRRVRGIASMAAAAAAMAAFLVHPQRAVRPRRAEPVAAIQAALRTEPAAAARPAKRVYQRRAAVSAAPYRVIGPPNRQPLVVKVITDDPNVVIYWISQGTGE